MPGLPSIVNLVPTPETRNVKLLKPIRFSFRDNDTHVNPASIRVMAAYSKLHADGTDFFDKQLPSTRRIPFLFVDGSEPLITKTIDGINIQNVTSNPERSVYATSIEAGSGYRSVALTAIIKPGVLTPFNAASSSGPLTLCLHPGGLFPVPFESESDVSINSGVILGLENGARNKVVYLLFQTASGTPFIRVTSYLDPIGSAPTINVAVDFDWTAFNRYTIIWNEVESFVEVYANSVATSDVRIFRGTISSFPDMPDDYFAKAGVPGSMTAVYGLIGSAGDDTTISNLAFTTDVSYPVLGTLRTGDFVTQIQGAEFLRVPGVQDPREADIATWATTPESVIGALDSSATSSSDAGIFTMVKPTNGKTFSLYREDPSLLSSSTEGFMVQAQIFATNNQQDRAASGMGFTIFDGTSVFQIQLFDDFASKTVGLLKKSGSDNDISEYFIPSIALSWVEGHMFRFVADPRRNVLRLYDGDDLGTPVLSIPFDRSTIPSAADKGWTGLTPFIALGHTLPVAANGIFHLIDFGFCHLYQAWDTADVDVPTAANPVFTRTTSGGSSAALSADGDFVITAPAGALDKFHRTVECGDHRGGVVEARVKIESWRKLTRTGTYLFLDDGLRTFALTFLENSLGKFAALSQRSGLGDFQEITGRDGDPSKLCFLIDWTAYHTYRLERLPYDGLKIYVDAETTPRIIFPESKLTQLPDVQFGGTPTIAFGQFSTEGATSRWEFVRGLFSRGYEVSFKKNRPDSVLKTDLFNTQAIIVAHAQDAD